jgi:signal transduction histidine kinase
MSKVIFIDDDQDILEQYNSVLSAKRESSALLKMAASELFSVDDELETAIEDKLPELEVFSCQQGLDGIEVVRRELKKGAPVQIAFIDMRMPPGIDGKETAKRIRALDSRIEIVIVTAYSDTRPDQLLKEIGAPDKLLYLKKPFDVAEIKQLIRNLSTKYRGERIKEEFITNVTHELKTPLASILGFSELLLLEESKSMNFEYVRVLHANAELMQTLISDLIATLDVSNSEIKIDRQPVNLTGLIMDTYKSFKAMDTHQQVSLNVKVPRQEVVVSVDPVRFKQALYNIVSNALKFTEQGQVDISIEDVGSELKLSVSDTGPGIAAENQTRIFEKFYRVENEHHSRPGLGIGLYLTKQIMDAHGISIKVESQLGRGTCFMLNMNKAS